MEVFELEIENPTLLSWASDFRRYGHSPHNSIYQSSDSDQKLKNANQAKEWFRCFNKLCRHFVAFVREPSVKQYVLDTFPLHPILEGLWSHSSALLSEFYGSTLALYDEDFHIEFINRYPDVGFTLNNLPYIKEHMPVLHSYLTIMK
ncbi:MAG: hypothetical protein M0R77_10590 [Gammaproteobacteria bacterium]|nr:hypothetical protein [Gammaproteobacteria bacterium]